MWFTCRYVVRPDGSFSRIGNIDGSLDNVSDEELARLHPDRPACDAHRPAARVFIQWHRDSDRDPKALPKLFEDWETETMHAHDLSPLARPSEPALHVMRCVKRGMTSSGRASLGHRHTAVSADIKSAAPTGRSGQGTGHRQGTRAGRLRAETPFGPP